MWAWVRTATIAQLAHTLAQVIGFEGKVVFDTSKPDGTPRKLLNVDKLRRLRLASTNTAASGSRADLCLVFRQRGYLASLSAGGYQQVVKLKHLKKLLT